MASYVKIFNRSTPEYARLAQAAEILTRESPNRWHYYVGETYFDFGQNWRWTTILVEHPDDTTGDMTTGQALYPADQSRIIEADDLPAALDALRQRPFWRDTVSRYIVTYSPDTGTGSPSHLSTYWATMARSSSAAAMAFNRRFPFCHIRCIELAKEENRMMYGNGWYTEDEQQARAESLRETYTDMEDARAEAEAAVRTYEQDEIEAMITYRDKREQEKTQNVEGVHVGDLFYVSWGYEQTNVNFFQVVGLRGSHTAILRPMQAMTADCGNMCGLTRPIRNKFIGEDRFTMRTRCDSARGTVMMKAPDGYGSGHYLTPCEDGRVFDYSTYA